MKILKTINKRELSYIVLIQLVFKFGYVNFFPFLKDILPVNLFFLLLLSVIFITSSGYLINAYINSKNSLYKNDRTVLITFIIISILGILFGGYVSVETGTISNSFIFIGFWLAVVFSSYFLERKSFLKNLIISLLLAFCTMIVWRFSEPTSLNASQWKIFLKLEMIIILYAILIFAGNIVRTTLVDLKFFKKDKINNITTIPTVFGIYPTKVAILIVAIVCFIIIIAISLIYLKNTNVFLSFIVLELVPFLYLYGKLKKAKSIKEYQKIIIAFDIVLFLGFLSVILVAYFIKNVV